MGRAATNSTMAVGCSARFLPTPGKSMVGLMPWALSSPAGPMPDSMSKCGELNAPPQSTTSRAASRRPPLASGKIFNAHRAAFLDENPRRARLHHDGQVLPVQHGVEIGARGARAPSACVDRGLAQRKALGLGAVDVVAHLVARARGRFQQRLLQELRVLDRPHAQRTVAAVVFAGTPPARFHAPEIGENVGVAPAFATHLTPGVEVARMAAHVEHAVDRGGAAQHFAARQPQLAAVQMRLGLVHVIPVEARIPDRAQEGERHLQNRDVNPPCPLRARGRWRLHLPKAGSPARSRPIPLPRRCNRTSPPFSSP